MSAAQDTTQAQLPAGPLPSLFVQERSICLVPMTGIKGFRAQSHLRMESTSQDASGCLPRVQLQSRWPKAKARPLPTPAPSFAATTQLVSVQKPHSCRRVPEGPALSHQARLPCSPGRSPVERGSVARPFMAFLQVWPHVFSIHQRQATSVPLGHVSPSAHHQTLTLC